MADDDLFRSMQEAIDKARCEGRAEGAAALAEALRDFLASFRIDDARQKKNQRQAETQVPKGRIGGPTKEYAPRIPRGVSKSLIADAFKSIAPRPAGPTEVQHAILREKNTDIPFTTLRRVIDNLTELGQLEAIGDTKTWRWVSGDVSREGSTVRPIRQSA
jgi:hypothetical protein